MFNTPTNSRSIKKGKKSFKIHLTRRLAVVQFRTSYGYFNLSCFKSITLVQCKNIFKWINFTILNAERVTWCREFQF